MTELDEKLLALADRIYSHDLVASMACRAAVLSLDQLRAELYTLWQDYDKLERALERSAAENAEHAAEVARLRAALKKIIVEADGCGHGCTAKFLRMGLDSVRSIASRTLAQPGSRE